MTEVLLIQHIECESAGTLAEALGATGISLRTVSVYDGEPVPKETGGAAGLVVMGGPMGVYEADRYPFLSEEIRLLERAVKEEKPVLGICLGSQLLAKALGATVTRGEKKEIGWYSVTLSDAALVDPLWKGVERSFMAYHWHGDVFEMPAGAERLASSALTPCQAFRYGKSAYGFLFHMEVTEQIIAGMIRTFADELKEEAIAARHITAAAAKYLPLLRELGKTVFGRWATLLEKSG